VAVFSHNLALGLAQRGHEVLVIAPSFNGKYTVSHEKCDDGKHSVKTVHLTSAKFPFYPDQIHAVPEKKEFLGMPMPRLAYKHGIWWATRAPFEVKKVLGEFKPDVIHLQTAETIALAIMHYVRKNDVPLVTTGHAYPDNVTGQFRFLKPVKKPVDAAVRAYMASFLKHSEYATMPTEMAIGDLIPKNRKRFKVSVEALSNGVDLSSFRPGKPRMDILRKYDIDMKKPRVLYVGRVDPEKSIENVVEAFSMATSKIPSIEFLIVGDGIAKNSLIKLTKEKGVEDKVKFLGRVMPPDLYEIYKTGTVFATASETETQGIVLIEAAATGLPLIAVDAGAVRELCQNKKNGILCKPKKIRQMANAMVKILSDAKLREMYSEGSIEVAKKHDINRTLSRFEEIYKIAIETTKATS
jgi:glycosyltransferase involved in cell wall biosynthesis